MINHRHTPCRAYGVGAYLGFHFRLLETNDLKKSGKYEEKKNTQCLMSNLLDAVVQKMASWQQPTYTKGLDPISTCIRLSMLLYKPIGTKLSFQGPSIHFDAPESLQWSVRTVKVSVRDHLTQLNQPIEALKQFYKLDHPVIHYLIGCSDQGLKRLKQTYLMRAHLSSAPQQLSQPLVCDSLDLYSVKLNELLLLIRKEEGKNNVANGATGEDGANSGNIADDSQDVCQSWFLPPTSANTKPPLHFKTLWSIDLLQGIASLLKEIERLNSESNQGSNDGLKHRDVIQGIMQSIELILKTRDDLLRLF